MKEYKHSIIILSIVVVAIALMIIVGYNVLSGGGAKGNKEVTTEEDLKQAESETLSTSELKIVVTTKPLLDFVQAIVGGSNNVTLLNKSKIDINAIKESDLIIYMDGAGYDAWVETAINKAELTNNNEIMEVYGVLNREISDYGWNSLNNAINMVNIIAIKLAEMDLAHSSTFNQNAQTYINKLEQLKTDIQEIVNERTTGVLKFNSEEEIVIWQSLLAEFALEGTTEQLENAIVADVELISTESGEMNYLEIMRNNMEILRKALN